MRSSTPSAQPHAVVVQYDRIIHPIAVEVMSDLLARAESSRAVVALLVLRTPGGLLNSTRDIVSSMIAARTPVVVFVGPSGARAASAGFIILLAADVAAVAPGTHVGAAHPVAATGEVPSDATMTKAAEDAAAFARTLAEARRRNATLAAEAVTASREFTDREALAAAPACQSLSISRRSSAPSSRRGKQSPQVNLSLGIRVFGFQILESGLRHLQARAVRVLNTCLDQGFRAGLADRAEAEIR
jgi:ATP-dependent protease ClpP protease subunit